MKKILIILSLCLILFITSAKASLPLSGKTFILDPGHGGKDSGTSSNNILEKDINLSISKVLEQELIKNGASVIMTRDGDYDLGSPNNERRKKSDFDNRIDLINNSNANMYLSIHTNYLNNTSYYGGQIFYLGNNNKKIAEKIQAQINTLGYARECKTIPNVYMYRQLKINGVLVEVGFLSNARERKLLVNENYQKKISQLIVKGLINYYS